MGLTVTVNAKVTLPDLTDLEAVAKEKIADLEPLRDDVSKRLDERLKALKVTREKIAELPPKLVDAQIRGKIGTLRRYDRDIAMWSGVVDAAKRVAAKDQAKLFRVDQRAWGRTRSRVYVTIVDEDLLLLRRAGVLGV